MLQQIAVKMAEKSVKMCPVQKNESSFVTLLSLKKFNSVCRFKKDRLLQGIQSNSVIRS